MNEKSTKFPLVGLLTLAMTGFLAIMTETLPAGLLLYISHDFDISKSAAGQLVTLYAIGSIIAAIPIIALTKKWSRKRLLLTASIGFFIFNSLTAISTIFWLTLVARLFVGMAAGVVWGMLAGYARRMVIAEYKGRAMAIVLSGTPVALSFGVPLGIFLGSIMDWHIIFGIMSIFSLILIIMIIITVPDFAGQTEGTESNYKTVWHKPGVRPILAVTLFWMGGHNIFYTYIAPFLSSKGISRIDISLLVFGVASLISIFIIGATIDKYLRKLAIFSLGLFALDALTFTLAINSVMTLNLEVALWGLSFGGAATILQTALGEAVEEHELDIVMSINATIWNISIALGAVVGGVLLDKVGVNGFPWVILVMSLIALLIVWRSKRYSFKSK